MRAIVLAVVAVLITILVYGVVALIVKMDDVGLHLAEKPSKASQRVGLALVVGDARGCSRRSRSSAPLAMLWVGGHIFLVSLYEIGGHDGLLEGTGLGDALHAPYDLVHHWEVDVHDALGGVARRDRRLAGQHGALGRSSASSSAASSWPCCGPSGWRPRGRPRGGDEAGTRSEDDDGERR